MKKQFLYLLALGLVISCSPKKKLITGTTPVIDDGIIEMVFVQVNDVYEISPLENGTVGGLAHVAQYRNELKKKNPNTFLFHAGDFLNPSLYSNLKVEDDKIKGKQMIEVMNAMDFDLVTLGNHEFDLKEELLQARLNESAFPWTSANCLQVVCEDTFYPFYREKNGIKEFIPDTYIIEAQDADGTDIKIGFFSVTLDSNPKDYVHYKDVKVEAKRAYEYLAEQTDYVIGLTHLSKETDIEIAKLLPNVPLLMGGHEHYNMHLTEGNTSITKADANAKTVYVHTLVYDHQVSSLTLNSELVEITPAMGADPEVYQVVKKWETVLNKKIAEIIPNPNEIIFVANTPLDGIDDHIRSGPTNLGVLIAESIAHSYNNEVDGVFLNGGSVRIDDRIEGNITAVDVMRVLPFGGNTVKIKMTGKLLKEILDFGVESSGKGAFLQMHQLRYDVAAKSWMVGDKQLDEKSTYTVATTDFLLKGLDIPFLTRDNPEIITITEPITKDQKDMRLSVIAYMKTIKNN